MPSYSLELKIFGSWTADNRYKVKVTKGSAHLAQGGEYKAFNEDQEFYVSKEDKIVVQEDSTFALNPACNLQYIM